MDKEKEIGELQKSKKIPLFNGERRKFVGIAEPRGFAILLRTGSYMKQYDTNLEIAEKEVIRIFEEDLKNKGLTGEHELLAPANVERGLWANVDGEWKLKGFMFLILGAVKGSGKLEGGARTASSVQFAWKPNEKDILITEIPVDKLVFRENPSVKIPRVSFTFHYEKFIELPYKSNQGPRFIVRSFPYPNDYLMGERLSRATLTTSSLEDLKGLPLPTRKNS